VGGASDVSCGNRSSSSCAGGREPTGKDQKRLRSAAEAHRLALLMEWEHAVCIKEPGAEE
jgi:hypothetical protein